MYIEKARIGLPKGITYLENINIAPPGFIQLDSGGPLFHTLHADGSVSGVFVLYLSSTKHPGFFYGIKFDTGMPPRDAPTEEIFVMRKMRDAIVEFQKHLAEKAKQ